MNRTRGIGLLLSLTLVLASPYAEAQKKKRKVDDTPAPAAPDAPASSGKKGSGYEFQPDQVQQSDQPSKMFERALKLYDGEDYYSASIELNKVVEGESGDGEANKQKAEFWMSKTLYNMKFYSGALTYFERIVQKGATHAYYNATLKWLASLSKQLPDSTLILEKIGKYQRQELEQPALEKVRDELYFLLGKYYYNKQQFKEAVSLFSSVPQQSESYVQAKLFEGATHVREFNAKPAVEAFKEVLRAAQKSRDPKVKPFVDLANLSLARTFYSTGQFDLAVKYFDKVSPDSVDWANSLFETSWANFMLKTKGYSKALGSIHTIQAPFFENYIKPESIAEALTVKATIYFYNCLFDRAKEAIDEFNGTYLTLAQSLKKMIDSYADNQALFDVAQKIREGTSGLDESTARAAKAVLSDRSLSKRFEFVDELSREIAQHDKADAAWKSTTVAMAVYQDLMLQKSLAVNETGAQARQRVIRLVGELAQLIKRVIKVEYEILQGEKSVLEESAIKEQAVARGGKAVLVSEPRVDDEHNFWPFVGEYWRDELGYYRFRVLNKCGGKTLEAAPNEEE